MELAYRMFHWLIAGVTIAALLVALVTSLLVHKFAPPSGMRPRSLWILLIVCLAFEVAVVSATPVAMSYRIVQDDRTAAARFASLKQSVEKTVVDGQSVCDGPTLQKRYSGPPFSTKDWNYITNNAVFENGYSFIVPCQQGGGGYAIEAAPVRDKIDGTHRFCTDECIRDIGVCIQSQAARCFPLTGSCVEFGDEYLRLKVCSPQDEAPGV
jgi:hypothetical protein